MNTVEQNFQLSVLVPSIEDFSAHYRNYGPLASGEGRFLFDYLVSPESFIKARVATLDLDLPAVAGIAKDSYEMVQAQNGVEWNDNLKRFIGAVICRLMETNGFRKTGTKRAIPHHAFTKGEFYELGTDS